MNKKWNNDRYYFIGDKNKIPDFIEHILPDLDNINQKEKEDIVHNFLVELIKDY